MAGKKLIEEMDKQKVSEEFYTPVPKGYKPGKAKYIVVAGSVMSGVGKGIFASSLAKLLQDAGLKVAPIKLDGYFNQDAGTLNPYRHGEVFVLDDGLECDMDLGSYERYMDKSLSQSNYLTSGRVFKKVLERERKGGYLGRDVQFIPHVTGEVKWALRNLALENGTDVVLCEIGGTVGDFENGYLIEAVREMMYEEGEHNVCFINISYIVEPPHLGEHKSKPAQLGLERLRMLGIQPDMVVCRSTNPISQKIREKMSVYSAVAVEDVIGLHNFDSVYRVPLMLHEMKADERVFDLLELGKRVDRKRLENELKKWKQFTEKNVKADKTVNIGIAGKYTGLMDSYASIIKALEHAATHNNAKVKISFIETTDIESGKLPVEHALKGLDGLIVPGGFGARGAEGKIACVKYCRENNLPFLGICYGFQMAVIEYARNVCGLKEANSTEIDAKTPHPVICILPEQEDIEELGGTMRLGGFDLNVDKGTKAFEVYGRKEVIRERFRHRFNVHTDYIENLEKNGLVFSGRAPQKRIMQILELPEHKFFMGGQFHPEFNSRPLRPAPLFFEFVKAALA